MGVEWNIGCLKCKNHIWLGSQKPFKWAGFQIGDENVMRFLSLHACCGNPFAGNLLLTNDGTSKIPWREENERLEWQEDILSRTFCFDSWNGENIICAACSVRLEESEANRIQKGNLKKNQFLWFCNERCFDTYLEYNKTDGERTIHDSSKTPLIATTETFLEVGCANCNTFVVIDKQEDSFGRKRDFEYLALFLSEHVGHDHLLIAAINPNQTPWSSNETHSLWKEYEY
jgi:hypothetical protein